MIKMTKESNTKIVGKGFFKKVTEDGIEIMDAKTGELDTGHKMLVAWRDGHGRR